MEWGAGAAREARARIFSEAVPGPTAATVRSILAMPSMAVCNSLTRDGQKGGRDISSQPLPAAVLTLAAGHIVVSQSVSQFRLLRGKILVMSGFANLAPPPDYMHFPLFLYLSVCLFLFFSPVLRENLLAHSLRVAELPTLLYAPTYLSSTVSIGAERYMVPTLQRCDAPCS
ncbi:hypothetical protein GGS21DRAFT_101496 [Xylaria nigripes]|nr:hypothetical protein GGS21DRAFT_101496 [Xylaria nigripes]